MGPLGARVCRALESVLAPSTLAGPAHPAGRDLGGPRQYKPLGCQCPQGGGGRAVRADVRYAKRPGHGLVRATMDRTDLPEARMGLDVSLAGPCRPDSSERTVPAWDESEGGQSQCSLLGPGRRAWQLFSEPSLEEMWRRAPQAHRSGRRGVCGNGFRGPAQRAIAQEAWVGMLGRV